MNRLTPAAIACMLLALSACGPGATQRAATAGDAQISSKDLTATLVRCAGSGDFSTFLAATKEGNLAMYREAEDTWTDAKTDGAVTGEIATFSDSQASCDLMNQLGGVSNAPGSPLIISTVLQFPDEASARHAYGSDVVMGLGVFSLRKSGDPNEVEGGATGLGPNSVTDSNDFFGLPVYVAMWQYKTLTLSLIAFEAEARTVEDVIAAQHARITRLNLASTHAVAAHSPLPASASGRVGRPIVLDVATITVRSVDLDAAPSSGDSPASPGDRFVKVVFDLLFRKTADGVNWTLRDAAGTSYPSGASDAGGMSIPPRRPEDERVVVWFEVPQTTSGLRLTVTAGPDTATVPLGG